MQSYTFNHAVFDATASSPSFTMVDLLGGDLGSPAAGAPRAASALSAPIAMLFGAIGLLGLWAVAPKNHNVSSPPAISTADIPVPRQPSAIAQAAVQNEQALGRLLLDLGAPPTLVQPSVTPLTTTAAQTTESLRDAEINLISSAGVDAETRLKGMQETFRATGLDARAYMAPRLGQVADGSGALPSPALRDAKLMAAHLSLDPALAERLQQAERRLTLAQTLGTAEAALPLSTPVDDPVRSSPFGERIDPFTKLISFHPGQDFSGHYGQPIHVTAPGVVSFVGQRSGYGNCVEVDHGYGFKTRYGHLEAFGVGVGQTLKTGDVIGRMGSTGRSTGVHLHYEVWASGRLMNPARFLQLPEGATLAG